MKVQFTNETKKFVTVAEMPAVRKVISTMKEDGMTAKDYAEMAAQVASACNAVKVLEASAEIAGNCRVWNAIAEGTERFDVWVKFTAFTGDGFVMGGAYITDLWTLAADNREDILSHMYIQRFKKEGI